MAQIRWAREPWAQGGCVQNFPRIKDVGRLKCSKKSGFLSNHVVVLAIVEQKVDAPKEIGLGGRHDHQPTHFVFLNLTLRINTQPTLAVYIRFSARVVLRAASKERR